METEQSQNQQSKINDYELKRQQRVQEQKLLQRKKIIKKLFKRFLIVALIAAPIGGLIWFAATRPPIPETDIVSKSGLHWHSQLSITIKGQKQEVSANIDVGGGVMGSTHTHDTSGQIHLEKQGLVTKTDINLAKLFKTWGKQFNSNCVFDSCDGAGGTVKMFVNGIENTEFENYQMKDKDKIEIKYEGI